MDPAISSRVRVANAAAPNTMLAFLPRLHMCSPSLGLLHNLKSSLQRMEFLRMLDNSRLLLRPFYGLNKWQTHLEQVRLARWGPKPRILTSRCSRSARLLVPYVRNSLKTAFKPIFSCEEEGPFRRNADVETLHDPSAGCRVQGCSNRVTEPPPPCSSSFPVLSRLCVPPFPVVQPAFSPRACLQSKEERWKTIRNGKGLASFSDIEGESINLR